MSQAAVLPPAEPEAAPSRGFGAILADLFFAPSAAFNDLARAPRILLPLAIVVALNLAFTFTWLSKMDVRQFMKAQIEESGRELTPDQVEHALSIQEKVFKPMAVAGAVVFLPIFIFGSAGVLLVVFRTFFGSELTFRQSASIVVCSFLTVGLVTTPLLLMVLGLKGDWSVDPQQALHAGPVLLLDRGSVGAAFYTLAAALDLFTFWTLALLSIGYGVATRRHATSAMWGIVPFWAAYVAIRVLMAAFRG